MSYPKLVPSRMVLKWLSSWLRVPQIHGRRSMRQKEMQPPFMTRLVTWWMLVK